jgi:DNA-binding MarR family transcriptional regulator
MTGVKDDFPDHALALLGEVMDGFRRDLVEALQGPDATRVPAPARGLRPSQIRLLSLTPVEGMRVTELAERVGMTKQALGELANVLEQQGLLETVRDPADRRVRILRPTRRGRKAVEASEAVIAEIEAAWSERLGQRKWAQLRRLLAQANEARAEH